MTDRLRLACVQVCAGNDLMANLEAAASLARAARNDGANFIAFPECVSMIEMGREAVLAKAAPEEIHSGLSGFTDLARELDVWLLGGTLSVKLDEDRVANRSYLLDPSGELRARYDKIHMFDVDLEDGESYRESATYRPGEASSLVETPWGKLGMTVCYDLRFPHLYRDLAKAGAVLLSVPSAFTRPTGRAHWEILLRARAIENGAFVFAPAQCGEHPRGRLTYGHSMIIDPWGEILAEAGEEPGYIVADLEMAKVAEARRSLPSLTHDRPYKPPV